MGNTFFTSDSHFGHANILSYDTTRHQFKDINHHDNTLIDNWNKIVHPNDEVYHLGDFALVTDPSKYFRRLNGNIHLILGNHDYRNFNKLNVLKFLSIQDTLYIKKYNIFLSHYPHFSWCKSTRGCIHLFGHVHEKFKHVPHLDRDLNKNLNVGVTWHNFTPVNLDQIMK